MTSSSETYRLLGASLPELLRPLNQDALAFRSLALSDGAVFSLIVADGVSSSERGGDAARLSVAALDKRASDLVALAPDLSTLPSDPAAWLDHSLAQAHNEVFEELRGSGICCVVTALVSPARRRFWVASVGDSSAFLFENGSLELLTPRDATVRARRQNGENVVRDGQVVLDKGLTQAVGQAGGLRVHVIERTFEETGGWLCTATDGVLEPWLADFLRERSGSLGQADLDTFCDRMRRESDDDTTLVLLRLGEDPLAVRWARSFRDYAPLSGVERAALLADAEGSVALTPAPLLAALHVEADDDRARRLVRLILAAAPPPTMEEWTGLLGEATREGRRSMALLLREVVGRVAMGARRER